MRQIEIVVLIGAMAGAVISRAAQNEPSTCSI